MINEEFDYFWLEVCEYANKMNLPVAYVEEEFLIDGELVEMKLPCDS